MHESLTIALLQARETAMGFFRPILKSHNLTEQQWRIIRVLANSRSIEFHELAAETCILRPSLTGILSRMERDKLIFRLKPVNDQRKLYVSLTQQGQELYDVARHQIEKGYAEIEAAFSQQKMGQLMTLLDELIRLGDQLPANVTAHPTKKL
ncbi:homoprotocatechuate degradation operon regulator HpaR [Serratia proteamaculans]|jgi:homoprotocatechuate degradation regulator HpaR|uniref:homoprotocatechuate degradation operon regulator HpaR n=1 Tax=Serratia TaxID=613 RepID=UPI001574F15B|nr:MULTISPECIES: homoprotocatechuate degradation operon regulator HpaR [Serratia]NTX80194.1 homoprotocatechuate degradation operon regulator HpaR [Serratia proteamaculans]NTZ29383.1 homoprotocatechuate degradation operon regulator HpaR [Serratia proteamaculans]CAI0867350.1 Benzoate anaerobic degradation regulator [Serratia quinivorans]CAI1030444.1 Benzoate anaerobic degradation regulator [Serratia quinivorans]CAI1064777.1 Benzoate anaerobic degradation regulator [Serratia quinivorans]